jgi:ABC-2 type transport system permease protein
MIVARLIEKDWYFNRWPIISYVVAGLGAVALLALPSEGAFFAGCVLLITVLITIGIHLVMTSVVHERTEQTLAFVMSLPVSPRQVTLAKIGANLSIFTLAWAVLVVATLALIAQRSTLPDGLIPFSLVVLAAIYGGYCLLLCVAIVSESMNWTVGAIVVGNLLMQAAIYGVSHVPAVAKDLKTDTIAWHRPIPAILAIEALVIALMLGFTLYTQSRKKEFV